MMRPVPWQTGEICGPDSAKSLTKANQIERDLKKAKRPLLIVGSEAPTEKHGNGDMVDFAIALSKTGKIPVVATGGAIKAFLGKDFHEAKDGLVLRIGNNYTGFSLVVLTQQGGTDIWQTLSQYAPLIAGGVALTVIVVFLVVRSRRDGQA